MSYTTNEYTVLTKQGETDIVIKPNVPFDLIPAGYKVTSFARVLENGKMVAMLQPGQTTEQVGGTVEAPKSRQKSVK